MKTLQDYLATNGSGSGPRGNRRVYVEASEIVKEHIKELEGKLGDIIGVRNLKLNVSVHALITIDHHLKQSVLAKGIRRTVGDCIML